MTEPHDRDSRTKPVLHPLVAGLIVIAPIVSFLEANAYPLTQPESLIVLGAAYAGIAIVWVLLNTLHSVIQALAFTVLVILVADIQLSPTGGLDVISSEYGFKGVLFLTVGLFSALLLAAIFWRPWISPVFGAMFATFVVSTAVLGVDSPEDGVRIDRSLAGNNAPPVIHLILDAHIGPAGMPEDIPAMQGMGAEIQSFYTKYGLKVVDGTYAQYPETSAAIANLMNLTAQPHAEQFLRPKGYRSELTSNPWFDALRQKGYALRIYQSSYLDLCSPDATNVEYCYTYSAQEVQPAADAPLPTRMKVKLIVQSLLYNSVIYRLAYPLEDMMLRWLNSVGIAVEGWDRRPPYLGGFGSMKALDQIARDVLARPKGRAFLAHILLPHDAYLYDADCQLRVGPDAMLGNATEHLTQGNINTPEQRRRRYAAYGGQMRCLYRKLDAIFADWRKAGVLDTAHIVVHGDHGSRIGLHDFRNFAIDELTPDDLRDHYSALFAYRLADTDAPLAPTPPALTTLFNRFAARATDSRAAAESGSWNVLYMRPPAHASGDPFATRAAPTFKP